MHQPWSLRASWKASKSAVSVGIGVPTICGRRKSTPALSNLQPSLSWSHEQGPSLFSNFLAVLGNPSFYAVEFNPEASEQDRRVNGCPATYGAEFCSKSFICHNLKSLSRFQSAPFSNVQGLEGYTTWGRKWEWRGRNWGILAFHVIFWMVSFSLLNLNNAHSNFTVVVQSLSRVQLFVTPWTAARQASLSFTISLSFLKLMSIESMIPSNHLILCHPLLLLPSIFPSSRVFSSELALWIRWPKYWSFSISPSNEHSVLISFRILTGLISLASKEI